MPIDPSQAATDRSTGASALELTVVDGEATVSMAEIHEGERLQQLLDANRFEKKQLADAIGVTKQAVQQWVKQPTFSPIIWSKLQVGLVALRLDPTYIRSAQGIAAPPSEDLTRLVEHWSTVQLSVLRRILDSDDAARRVLLAYVNGSLRSR